MVERDRMFSQKLHDRMFEAFMEGRLEKMVNIVCSIAATFKGNDSLFDEDFIEIQDRLGREQGLGLDDVASFISKTENIFVRKM